MIPAYVYSFYGGVQRADRELRHMVDYCSVLMSV